MERYSPAEPSAEAEIIQQKIASNVARDYSDAERKVADGEAKSTDDEGGYGLSDSPNPESIKSELSFEEQEIKDIVEGLKEPIKTLLLDISERIRGGEYSAIIGDDASGRAPALIISSIIKSFNEANNIEPPQTLFVAGSMGLNQDEDTVKRQEIDKLVKKQLACPEVPNPEDNNGQPGEQKRVMVVTDCINEGTRLKPLVDTLKANGIEMDILVISKPNYLNNPHTAESIKNSLGVENIFFGNQEDVMILHNGRVSGVKKRPQDLHSYSIGASIRGSLGLAQGTKFQSKLDFARNRLDETAKELTSWFLNYNKGQT